MRIIYAVICSCVASSDMGAEDLDSLTNNFLRVDTSGLEVGELVG